LLETDNARQSSFDGPLDQVHLKNLSYHFHAIGIRIRASRGNQNHHGPILQLCVMSNGTRSISNPHPSGSLHATSFILTTVNQVLEQNHAESKDTDPYQ
jgi:hypothetical protein